METSRSDNMRKTGFNRQAMLKEWKSELNETVLSLDVEKFKKFYYKWCKLGIYDIKELPDDKILEITMRKMIVNMTSEDVPPEKKKEAKYWLLDRGYDLRID